jgi:hypothetical protein
LLQRLGLSDQFNPLPPNPTVCDQNADWFVHLRHGLAVSKALPLWLSSPDIGGLPLRLSDQAVRKIEKLQHVDPPHLYQGKTSAAKEARPIDTSSVAIELMYAAPLMIALLAEAARAKAASLRPRKPLRGARQDVFRRVLFRELTRCTKTSSEFCRASWTKPGSVVVRRWIGSFGSWSARRGAQRRTIIQAGADLREIAQESKETLAKNLQTARTEIGRIKLNSSAVTQ